MNASIESREFGVHPTGETVQAWTLTGSGGLVVEAITYGGIVRSILAPDRFGELADVVLGLNTLEEYLAGHPYFGAIVGRVAGRITGARFDLKGECFQLTANDGPNHLHGGLRGFDRKLWVAQPTQQDDIPRLVMTTSSEDGEEGYPGNVRVSVTYSVLGDNTFLIETEAVSDRPTPFGLTHHSYFNLASAASGPVLDHTIRIDADQYVPFDEQFALTGRLQNVVGSSEDLRRPVEIGKALVKLDKRHGSLYKIRRRSSHASTVASAAQLVHSHTGRVLDVLTTEPYVQFYTGVSLDGTLRGKAGVRYGPHQGVCLECEGYPDGVSTPALGNIVLAAGRTQRSKTAYRFSVLQPGAPVEDEL